MLYTGVLPAYKLMSANGMPRLFLGALLATALGALLVTPGCGETNRGSSTTAPGDPSAGQEDLAEKARDAGKGEAVVQPVSVREEGRSTLRVFVLTPGQGFQLERNGIVWLLGVNENEIVIQRTYKGTMATTTGKEHAMGNHEYVSIISAMQDPPKVKLRLRTRRLPWWDWSF